MRDRLGLAVSIAVFAALASPLALAQPPGKGHDKKTAGEKVREVLPEGEMVFSVHQDHDGETRGRRQESIASS